MEVVITNRAGNWRDKGRPPTEIPQEIVDLLEQTYHSGKVGTINTRAKDYDEDEADELLRLMMIASRRMPGKTMRIQRDESRGLVMFELVDRKPRRKTS